MPGRLTTHVLDTTQGRPADGVEIDLFRVEDEGRMRLKRAVTNADGRCDAPLLEGEGFAVGTYEVIFAIGDYFRRHGVDPRRPAFLERVPIRFGIADPEDHYHVPLLVSPFGYTTYRGS